MTVPLLYEEKLAQTISICSRQKWLAEEFTNQDLSEYETNYPHRIREGGSTNTDLTQPRVAQWTEVSVDKMIGFKRSTNETTRHLMIKKVQALHRNAFVVPALRDNDPKQTFRPSNGNDRSSAIDEVCIIFVQLDNDKVSPVVYCNQLHPSLGSFFWNFGHFAAYSLFRHTESDDHITHQALEFL